MARRWVTAVLVLALPGVAAADEDYRHGRIRHVEDGVSIQRAAEPGAEEAEPNVPFLPGDRVWTDERGRGEFQFDGAFLRLDNATKLDYLDHSGQRVVLRLWSGALYIHQTGRDIGFEIETPGGVVSTRGRGVYRIDSHSGETRVSVYEGEAAIEGGRGARIRAGERVFARDGEVTQGPMAFDAREADDFAMWADERLDSLRYAQERPRPADLPEEAAPYYEELFDHGSWSQEASVGFVWRPRVALGWQPYVHGRWIWTSYGWTWVANERWGWTPFHYGRWGYSPAGWYWIPQRGWGPGWVKWAVGGPYVGWCPLGFGNRPVFVHDRHYRAGGYVAPAGSGYVVGAGSASWIYARHGDMTARDLARRRVRVDPAEMSQIRMLASPRARLSKDLRVVEGLVVKTGPTVRNLRATSADGDTVPEPRTDNQATVRAPSALRRGNSFGAAAGETTHAAPRAPTGAEQGTPAERERPAAAARRAFGAGESGRTRYRQPTVSAEPANVAAPEAAPVARSRPRAGEDGGISRQRGGDEVGTPRQYGAAPRERAQDDGGQRRAGSAERADSGGEARPRAERAPRQESAPPAAQAAPAAREGAHSGRARRRD